MRDPQSFVAATAVALLLIMGVYFTPWRIQPEGEIEWAPIYRPPIGTYTRTATANAANFGYKDANVAIDVLAVEVLLIGAVGWVGYKVSQKEKDQ